VDDDKLEPPVPPGLQNLSATLKRFADFLRLDPDLIEVAAGASLGEAATGPSAEELARWVAALPAAQKNEWLVRVMQGEALHLGSELLHQFRQDLARSQVRSGEGPSIGAARRTVGSILDARDVVAEENRRRAAARAAKEQARRAREQAAARARYLDSLTGREDELWQQVEAAVATKQAKEYKRAVTLLQDLRDLGERSDTREAFVARLRQLRERHSSKWSLIRQLDEAGLSS
jgi:hypothetical protein